MLANVREEKSRKIDDTGEGLRMVDCFRAARGYRPIAEWLSTPVQGSYAPA